MKASNVIATQTEGQKSRVESTLFMLESADGKITSGANDNLDSDRDWKRIAGVKEGLHQYYKIEESIAFCCLNTGRVMEKIGINSRADVPHKDARLTFFLIDRRPHLNEKGINYLSQWLCKLFIVTDNSSHPAFTAQRSSDNVEVVFYQQGIDLPDLFRRIRQQYNFEKVVIQSGGTLNAQLLRQGLIDHVV